MVLRATLNLTFVLPFRVLFHAPVFWLSQSTLSCYRFHTARFRTLPEWLACVYMCWHDHLS